MPYALLRPKAPNSWFVFAYAGHATYNKNICCREKKLLSTGSEFVESYDLERTLGIQASCHKTHFLCSIATWRIFSNTNDSLFSMRLSLTRNRLPVLAISASQFGCRFLIHNIHKVSYTCPAPEWWTVPEGEAGPSAPGICRSALSFEAQRAPFREWSKLGASS